MIGVGEDESVKNQFSDNLKRTRSDSKPNLHLVKAVNPFLSTLRVDVVRREGGYERTSGGDFRKSTFFTEKDTRAYLYTNPVNRSKVLGLNASGMRLFVWMIYTLDRGMDCWWLNIKRFMKEANVSLNTVKAGVSDLISCGIISRTDIKDVYFIDPSMVYLGNRLTDFEDMVFVVNGTVSLEKQDVLGASSSVFLDEDLSDNDFESMINDVF